ncbi:hypothetical protein RZS08_46875, partial [Arthrospira platensis SPKY1]|nr:hypothetical protein [Arthrospira platensis SPKY1]
EFRQRIRRVGVVHDDQRLADTAQKLHSPERRLQARGGKQRFLKGHAACKQGPHHQQKVVCVEAADDANSEVPLQVSPLHEQMHPESRRWDLACRERLSAQDRAGIRPLQGALDQIG